MKIKSYSKINLFLLVSKKKKSTLHKIKSLFLLNKDLYDEIDINKSNELKINYYIHNKKININNCNAKRILIAIKDKYNININFDITINKNIPIGSGIGGSSSNAAYVAKYILDLNNIDYKNDYDFFINIGSDIPFFLSGFECAYVSEYGNKIKEKKKPNIKYELIFNDIQISTKDVYNNFIKINKNYIIENYFFQMLCLKFKLYSLLRNDLLEPCLNIYKELNSKYILIKKSNKNILVVGSGCCFVVYI